MTLTRSEITNILGPIDNQKAAELAATDATPAELAQAWAWVNNDEALINDGRPLPSGRVAQLVDILEPPAEEDEL